MAEAAEVKDTQTAAPAQEAAQAAPNPPRPPVRRRAGKRKIIKRLIALGVAAVVFGGGGFALYRFLTATDEEVGEIFPVQASIATIQSKASGRGTARAKESAAITLTQSGTVQEVFVTGGQTVFAGDPLYTIFSQAAEDAVSDARKKVEDLYEDMSELQEESSNLTIRAPFSGKLMVDMLREFNIDDNIHAEDEIATLVNDKKLKLSLYFSYAYEDDIRVGQSADVSVPAVMRTFTGQVETINKVSFISPEGAVHFEVVIVFDNPGTLTAEMEASAVLTNSDGEAIYPYRSEQTRFYETRPIKAKASGPVIGVGNLLNYANVSEGEALLYLGSTDIDQRIRAKQEEINEAQEKLDEAMKALADFSAVAPIDGTVTSCNLTEGQEVRSGDTVVMISNNVTMLVTITVNDQNISFIKPGSFVDLNWNGMIYQGEVTSIDMAGAQSGQGMTNYPVTLSVANWDGSLMEGAYLSYSFVTSESEECVVVPNACVRYFPDLDGNRCTVVFVQRDEPPEDIPELEYPTFEPGQKRDFPTQEEGYYPVIVETGLADLQNTEIRSGIEAGDMVFLNYTVTGYSGW